MRTTAYLLALALPVALTQAAGPSPEPPAKPMTGLYGTWKARGLLRDGAMRNYLATYTFAEGKAILASGKAGRPREMTLEVDRSRKGLIEMKHGPASRTMRYFYKIEK